MLQMLFKKSEIQILQKTKQSFLKSMLRVLKNTPFDHYSSRIKSDDSMLHKLTKKGLPATPDTALQFLTDIIGIRIVTQYIKDVYEIVNVLKQHFDVYEECDYIANPKPSGYRSYHVIIYVPLKTDQDFFGHTIVPIEIQIRTMGMDFWASLEHNIVYNRTKSNEVNSNSNESLVHNELIHYANEIFSIDMRIQALQHLTEQKGGETK